MDIKRRVLMILALPFAIPIWIIGWILMSVGSKVTLKGVKTTKIKELKKLAEEVQKASSFAEEVKAKITEDLKRLAELDTFVNEFKSTILALDQQVKGANDTLKKLDELLS